VVVLEALAPIAHPDIVSERLIIPFERGELTRDAFGKTLREVRISLRVSMRRLSKRSKLTMVTLSRIERGVGKGPHSKTVEIIFKTLWDIQQERRAKYV